MTSKDLFIETLTDEDSYSRKSYNITKLIYVAFFGGIIPTIWLGTKNAKWLNIDRKKINLLMGIGIILFLFTMTIYWMVTFKMIAMGKTEARIISKGASLLMYLGYYKLMKSEFRQHIYFGGNILPMFKDAIVAFIISAIIELPLIGIIAAISGVI